MRRENHCSEKGLARLVVPGKKAWKGNYIQNYDGRRMNEQKGSMFLVRQIGGTDWRKDYTGVENHYITQ